MHDLERCPVCGKLKPTVYGAHIDGVLADVPQSEQCCCPARKPPVPDAESRRDGIEGSEK